MASDGLTRRLPRSRGPLGRTYLEVTLAVLALVTIVAFEAMAVSTAMPAVARDLDAVRSYGFAFSVMLTAQLLGIVLAGVWSDRSGPMVGAVTGQALLARRRGHVRLRHQPAASSSPAAPSPASAAGCSS